MTDNERMIDVIIFIVSLVQVSLRFAMKQEPLDFENVAVAEYLTSKVLPFVRNEDISSEEAHKEFILDMFMAEWKLGAEDFPARVHPELVEWSLLSQESKEHYAFLAGVVSSAKEFYLSLSRDIEEALMDEINSMLLKEKPLIPGVAAATGVTH